MDVDAILGWLFNPLTLQGIPVAVTVCPGFHRNGINTVDRRRAEIHLVQVCQVVRLPRSVDIHSAIGERDGRERSQLRIIRAVIIRLNRQEGIVISIRRRTHGGSYHYR